MNVKIIAVVAVAIIAAGAVAGVFIMNNQGDDTKKSDARFALQILGNANEDYTLDGKDIKIIEKIIAGELKSEDYPYADANNDKEVNDADKQIVQDLIDKKEGSVAYVVNLDSRKDDQSEIVTKVTYPLKKIVPYGVNIVEPIIAIGGGEAVAAYFASGYPVQEKSMKGVDLKGGTRSISDTAWKNFLSTDAKVGFDAFILTYDARAQVKDTHVADLNKAEIPILTYAAASPNGEANAAVTIGFLIGGNSEKLGQKYAEIYNQVLDDIENKIGTPADDKKTVYLGMTMYASVCQNSSTYQEPAIAAQGLPYYKTDATFATTYKGTSSTASTSVEQISNIDVKKILNYRSIDQVTDAKGIKDVIIGCEFLVNELLHDAVCPV